MSFTHPFPPHPSRFAGFKESQEYRAVGIGSLLGDITSRMVGSVEKTTADGEYELQTRGEPGQHGEAVKFGMSGCHDTTLAASLASLGAFNTQRWPPFTSHVAFEMFRKAGANAAEEGSKPGSSPVRPSRSPAAAAAGQPPAGGIGRKPTEELTAAEKEKLEGYYVRVRYNDEVVTIPGCKPAGKHLEGDESFCTLVCHLLSDQQANLPPTLPPSPHPKPTAGST